MNCRKGDLNMFNTNLSKLLVRMKMKSLNKYCSSLSRTRHSGLSRISSRLTSFARRITWQGNLVLLGG